MTEKRFIYCFEGIEDKWETVEEYKYTPCTKDGFQDLCVMLNDLNDQIWELKKENEQLKRFFIIQQNNFTKEDELKITVREELYNLCNKINNKMKEVYIKTPNTCYIDYKNQLYGLLKKMDTSIESFKRDY